MISSELLTKCSVCGQQIIFKPEENLARCPWCDRINERPKGEPEGTSLMKYANERRNIGEFKEAEEAYRKVLQACTEEHEARWGLLLCKYGVLYMESADGKERVITCRRARTSSFQSEPDYQIVLQQSSPEMQAVYEKDAAYIDRVQTEIQKLKAQTEPYDVFLCYKETDPEGGKTEDSAIAHDLYNDLTHSGYRVFFAPESLKDKTGANYEAAIFVAIENSMVMLVIGTQKEYFTGTWVRSEWQRFLEQIDLGEDKLLLPLFRRADDLPDAFKNRFIQGYEMKGPYMRDVKSRLNRVLRKEDSRYTLAMIYLKGGNFQSADQYLDLLLIDQPQNAKIWLAKAMAAEQIRQEEELPYVNHSLKDDFCFQQALEFASGYFKEKLEGYLESNEKALRTAEEDSRAEEARKEEEECKAEEARRAEGAREAEENQKHEERPAEGKKKKNAFPAVLIVVCVAAGVIWWFSQHPMESFSPSLPAVQTVTVSPAVPTQEPAATAAPKPAFSADDLGFLYSELTDNKIVITGYSGTDSDLVIPSVLDGHEVVSIGESAFANSETLTHVTIPSGVTSIGPKAFSCCEKLSGVSIPNSVVSIGFAAFEECSSLNILDIPESVTSIDNYAFSDCGLTHVTIPSGMASTGNYVFYSCPRLASVEISDGVSSIGECAFGWCDSLVSVTIPKSVTMIEDYAFMYCSALTEVIIPSSVTGIGTSAFEGCVSLTSAAIPASVTSIGSDAFYGCDSLTIYGKADSAAAEYAKEHEIKFAVR